MGLLDLPNELIISIANCLKHGQSLSRFARTNRDVYNLVIPLLYQHDINDGGCSGLEKQLAPLKTTSITGRFFTEMEEDLEEYNNPSDLTTPEGLPLPVTDEIRIRDVVIGQFVKHGVNLDTFHLAEGEYKKSLLHHHIALRNTPAVFLLAKHGADLHATSGYEQRTALHWAALWGCAKIIRFLIGNGLVVNARDEDEKTPLHYAAQEGQVAAIRLLVENGADINAQDEWGCTPLHLMMMNGKPAPDSWCIPALKAILELGPNTELGMFEDNKTPLHVAILNARDSDFLEVLLESGMDLNSRTVEGRTPLSCCVERGLMHVFEMLVKRGADVHTMDEGGRSLLQIALEDEDRAWDCLPNLLENRVYDLNSDAGDGMTLVQFLRERRWLYTIKDRVDGIREVDELESD